MGSSSEGIQSKSQFACLFTKHKTQKRKLWVDGRLVIGPTGARLHHASPIDLRDPVLDECELSHSQAHSFVNGHENQLETENFLIEIEGVWSGPAMKKQPPQQGAAIVSNSMRKIMARKFRQPAPYVPPNTSVHKKANKKRSNPLQPGELQRRYYGPPVLPHHPSNGKGIPEKSLQHQQDRQQGISHGHARSHDAGHEEVGGKESSNAIRSSLLERDGNLPRIEHKETNVTAGTFVHNGFNHARFYTEEEEEELADEEVREDALEVRSQFELSTPLENDNPTWCCSVGPSQQDKSDVDRSQQQTPERASLSTNSNVHTQTTSETSTSNEDLLRLFGVSPTPHTHGDGHFHLPPSAPDFSDED